MATGGMNWGNILGNVLSSAGSAAAGAAVNKWLSDDPEYNISQQSRLSPTQQKAVNSLMSVLNREIGMGVMPYPGQMVAEASPLQQMLFQQGTNLAQIAPAMQQQGLKMMDTEQWDPSQARELWQTSVRDPMLETWQDKIVPQVQEKYAAQNALSSGAANRALAESGRKLTSDIGSQLAQLLYQDRQSHRDYSLQQQSTGLNTLTNALQQMQGLAGIGESQRGVKQDLLQEPLKKWLQMQPYNNPWLQFFNQGVNPTYQENFATPEPTSFGTAIAPALGQSLGTGLQQSLKKLFSSLGSGQTGATNTGNFAGGINPSGRLY